VSTLIVLAKAPSPGRSKTRLTPPCTPEQAAALARAALTDTLDVVLATAAKRRVLVLDGDPRPWRADGLEILTQRPGGLGARLTGAFADVGVPALLVGMDTPQITADLLSDGLDRLAAPGASAILGPAPDGGYWAIGLSGHIAGAFDGVPMSSADTATCQRRRLTELGLEIDDLPVLRDFDTLTDARAVAHQAPNSRFAAELARVEAAVTRGARPPASLDVSWRVR